MFEVEEGVWEFGGVWIVCGGGLKAGVGVQLRTSEAKTQTLDRV